MEESVINTENSCFLVNNKCDRSQRIEENDTDTLSSSVFTPFPSSHPFVNTDYSRDPQRAVSSFPECNRDGVIAALKNLQEKMSKLELERLEAEKKLQTLSSERHICNSDLRHREAIGNGENIRQFSSHPSSPWIPGAVKYSTAKPIGFESKLSSAETRCQLLEKQLHHMRRLVHKAGSNEAGAVRMETPLQQQSNNFPQLPSSLQLPDYQQQLDRLGELERDHLRLTTTQTLAESKINELEGRLRDENFHRRKLQERAIDLESQAMSNRILLDSVGMPGVESEPDSGAQSRKALVGKKIKGKRKKAVVKKPTSSVPEPAHHYRLNLADIPFVAGKSTAESHAVGANVQKLIAMMKSHNHILCSSPHSTHRYVSDSGQSGRHRRSPSLSSASRCTVDRDLTELLNQLQDEFGQLSLEHQEYLKRIQSTKEGRVRGRLEQDLDGLVGRMEAKRLQICKIRQHQQKLLDLKRHSKVHRKGLSHPLRPNSAMGRLQGVQQASAHKDGNLPPKTCNRSPRPNPGQALDMLKGLKKLQSTLRRDDVCWE